MATTTERMVVESSRAMIRAWLGSPGGALEAAERVADLQSTGAAYATFAAWAGELDGAERLAQRLPAASDARQKVDAVVALRRGRLAEARALLEGLEKRDPYGHVSPILPSFLLAEVAAAAGDAEATKRWVLRYHATWPRGLWRSWAWPRSLHLLAEAHERLGERAEALAAIDRLDALWKNADEGAPLVAESRKLRSRLLEASRPKGRNTGP